MGIHSPKWHFFHYYIITFASMMELNTIYEIFPVSSNGLNIITLRDILFHLHIYWIFGFTSPFTSPNFSTFLKLPIEPIGFVLPHSPIRVISDNLTEYRPKSYLINEPSPSYIRILSILHNGILDTIHKFFTILTLK